MGRRAKQTLFRNQTWRKGRAMRLRQAKKIMGWCNGKCDSRSKDHRDSFWRKMQKLRPAYINENGVYVQPSMHDIDIIRRAHTRLFRWIRKGDRFKEHNHDRQFENQL